MAINAFLPLKPADFHVLLALSDGPRHGYGIMKDVERESAGEVRLEIGSLYRLLDRMLDEGLLEGFAQPDDERRRYFRITRLGRRVLRSEARRLESLVALMRARNLLPEKS
jgi:DNA-binding PadR family transcriptional regulator